jgi:hypothetical protein
LPIPFPSSEMRVGVLTCKNFGYCMWPYMSFKVHLGQDKNWFYFMDFMGRKLPVCMFTWVRLCDRWLDRVLGRSCTYGNANRLFVLLALMKNVLVFWTTDTSGQRRPQNNLEIICNWLVHYSTVT